MSSGGQGQTLSLRAKSRITPGRVGRVNPEFIVNFTPAAAPGPVGTFVFIAPAPCRVVRIGYVADTNGAGASKVFVRKHVAGQTAAASAATSSTNIVDVVATGIAADSTVRVPTTPTIDTANDDLTAGAKLAVVTPATWLGALNIYLIWTS